MAKKKVFDIILVLQVALGLFFIVSGVLAIMDYDSVGSSVQRTFGNNDSLIGIIVGVLFLVCGIVMLVALFLPISKTMLKLSILIVFIAWAVLLILNDIVMTNFNGLDAAGWMAWIQQITVDLVMLVSIWLVREKRYI